MKRTLFSAAAIAAVAFAAPAAHAQDTWTTQVRRLIQQGGQQFEQRGYEMTHQITTGSLNNSSNEYVTVELAIGRQYALLGACDTDCSDLDLQLFDPSGNKVSEDVETDDFPIVTVTPSRSGTYRVKVLMATCSAEPCRYGVGVFAK